MKRAIGVGARSTHPPSSLGSGAPRTHPNPPNRWTYNRGPVTRLVRTSGVACRYLGRRIYPIQHNCIHIGQEAFGSCPTTTGPSAARTRTSATSWPCSSATNPRHPPGSQYDRLEQPCERHGANEEPPATTPIHQTHSRYVNLGIETVRCTGRGFRRDPRQDLGFA